MGYNALIVDDSRLACKVLADMLTPLNIASISVYSAEQALDYLKTHQPDVIFLDHTMPGMDGLQTIQVIKSNPKTAMVPVVMYTAKEGEVYVGQARALGAVDVIPKGTETEHLYNALHQLGMLGEEGTRQLKQKLAQNVKNIKTADATSTSFTEPLGKDSANKDRKVTAEEELDWRQVWQKQIAPYLQSQRDKQTEELSQFSLRQTRYLNREIHKTLEHFEHALMSRLEAHDDFLAIKQEAVNQKRRRWVGAIVGMVVVLQVAFIGFFYQNYNTTQQLIVRQQESVEWQLAAREKIEKVNEKIVQLLEVQETSQSAVYIDAAESRWLLQNERDEILAELKPIDSQYFQATSETGYQFVVDTNGNIENIFIEQYFLTDNCQGDAFVDYKAAQVFSDREGLLWFTDKFSDSIVINVNSRLNEHQECVAMQSESLALRRLQPNHSAETGLDENARWMLISN